MADPKRSATAATPQSCPRQNPVKTEPSDDIQVSSPLSSVQSSVVAKSESEVEFASDSDGKGGGDSEDESDAENDSHRLVDDRAYNSTAEHTKYDASDSEYAEKAGSLDPSEYDCDHAPSDASDNDGEWIPEPTCNDKIPSPAQSTRLEGSCVIKKEDGSPSRVLSGNDNADETQPIRSCRSELSPSGREVFDDNDIKENDMKSESDEGYVESSSDTRDEEPEDPDPEPRGAERQGPNEDDEDDKPEVETLETSLQSDSQTANDHFEEKVERSSSSSEIDMSGPTIATHGDRDSSSAGSPLSEIPTPDATPALEMENDELEFSDARGGRNSDREEGHDTAPDETEWEGSNEDHGGDGGTSENFPTRQSSLLSGPENEGLERIDLCPSCYARVTQRCHTPENCPERLRTCDECLEEPDKHAEYTEPELRHHHQRDHQKETSARKKPWSLDEEKELSVNWFFRRINPTRMENTLSGRSLTACSAHYLDVKPKGYDVFDIEVKAGAPPAALDSVYRGFFLCAHRVAKSLALSWIKALGGCSDWWPSSVRRITDIHSRATLNGNYFATRTRIVHQLNDLQSWPTF